MATISKILGIITLASLLVGCASNSWLGGGSGIFGSESSKKPQKPRPYNVTAQDQQNYNRLNQRIQKRQQQIQRQQQSPHSQSSTSQSHNKPNQKQANIYGSTSYRTQS